MDLLKLTEYGEIIERLDSPNVVLQLRALETIRRAGFVWSELVPSLLDLLDRVTQPPAAKPRIGRPRRDLGPDGKVPPLAQRLAEREADRQRRVTRQAYIRRTVVTTTQQP